MRAWIYPIDSESQLQPTVHWRNGGVSAGHGQWDETSGWRFPQTDINLTIEYEVNF